MKTAKRLNISKEDLEKLEEQLVQYVYDNVYKGVFDILNDKELYNAENKSLIITALRSGAIYFDGVGFKAENKFGSKIAKEFIRLKAVLKNGRYILPKDINNPEIQTILAEAKLIQERVAEKIRNIESFLLSVGEPTEALSPDKIEKFVNKVASQASTAFGIKYDFTPENKQFFVKNYIKNVEFYVKKLSLEANAELKAYVLAEASQLNLTTKSLAKTIQERFNVTERHAKFIARNEAHMARESINKKTAKDLGFNYYVWQTVGDYKVRPAGGTDSFMGDNHRRLNGMIFSFDDPPVVDRQYNRRCNPGEDYNCRCTARVIVADKDILHQRIEVQKKKIEDAERLQSAKK